MYGNRLFYIEIPNYIICKFPFTLIDVYIFHLYILFLIGDYFYYNIICFFIIIIMIININCTVQIGFTNNSKIILDTYIHLLC